ncbi:unnamed protein product [Ectocarpus fasciculatus]
MVRQPLSPPRVGGVYLTSWICAHDTVKPKAVSPTFRVAWDMEKWMTFESVLVRQYTSFARRGALFPYRPAQVGQTCSAQGLCWRALRNTWGGTAASGCATAPRLVDSMLRGTSEVHMNKNAWYHPLGAVLCCM